MKSWIYRSSKYSLPLFLSLFMSSCQIIKKFQGIVDYAPLALEFKGKKLRLSDAKSDEKLLIKIKTAYQKLEENSSLPFPDIKFFQSDEIEAFVAVTNYKFSRIYLSIIDNSITSSVIVKPLFSAVMDETVISTLPKAEDSVKNFPIFWRFGRHQCQVFGISKYVLLNSNCKTVQNRSTPQSTYIIMSLVNPTLYISEFLLKAQDNRLLITAISHELGHYQRRHGTLESLELKTLEQEFAADNYALKLLKLLKLPPINLIHLIKQAELQYDFSEKTKNKNPRIEKIRELIPLTKINSP